VSLDITAFSVTPLPPTELGVLPYAIDALVRDQTGRHLIDRRGESALVFPFCLTLLPPAARRQFVLRTAQQFVEALGIEARDRDRPIGPETPVQRPISPLRPEMRL
jgi:hypothetical protein